MLRADLQNDSATDFQVRTFRFAFVDLPPLEASCEGACIAFTGVPLAIAAVRRIALLSKGRFLVAGK